MGHDASGIGDGVEGDDGVWSVASFALVATSLVLGVFLLDVAGVLEEDLGGFDGGGGGVDATSETVADEPRQIAGVIEMGVGEEDGIDAVRGDREGIPVTPEQFSFLVDAAVDQDAGAFGFE